MTNYIDRAQEILNAEIEALSNITFDTNFEKAIIVLKECTGKVITTGIGKAGNIAKKMSGTLCSTGTPSIYLHPGEAAHGDLGLLDKNDIIIAFSTSGKTREVIEMLELAHHFGINTIIGITSHPDSVIRSQCHIVIDMGIIEEPCRLKLTPTSSTVVMLAIGDALSMVLMDEKKFTKKEYGLRHHGGYLGEKANHQDVQK